MKNIIFVGRSWNIVYLLYGPAKLMDGLIGTLTFGVVISTFTTEVSLMMARRVLRRNI